MEVLSARISSFKKQKRVKNPEKPSSTTTLKWPHPADFQANSETLAEAGFYYDPSYDDPDNVTCFVCEKELGGWEEEDDPFLIHWTKCGQTCYWASVRCGLLVDVDHSGRFVSADKTRVPAHKSMEKRRLETFGAGKGWIHDKTKGHCANSKSMASAGFVYTPRHNDDDLATCFYCNTSLSGWDEADDPLEEHRKRVNKSGYTCPFFAASSEVGTSTKPPSKAQSTKPPSKSQSKPPSRSTSRTKYQDSILPTKTFDGDDDSATSEIANPRQSTAKTPRKGSATTTARKSSAKTPKSKTRSSSRSGLKNVVEEDEDDDNSPTEPPPTVKKKVRSDSKSVPRSEIRDNTEVEEEVTESRKPSRSRSKKPVIESEADVEEEVVRKSSRSKSKASIATFVTEDEAPRKPSRTKAKPKTIESEQEELPLVTPKPKQKRTVSRSKSKAPVEPFEVDAEPESNLITVAPKQPKHKRTVSRSQSRAAVETSEVDSEPEPRVAATPKPKYKPTVSKSKSKASVELPQADYGPEVVTAAPKPKHKRTVSRSKSKAPVEPEIDSEPEPQAVTVAPPAKKLTKTQIPPVEDLFNDDVAMNEYVPPPSSPPLMLSHISTTELTPLIVPKRDTKRTVQQVAVEEVHPVEKEKRKPGRPKAKPQTASRPPPAEDGTEQPTTSVDADSSVKAPQPPTKDKKPTSKAKLSPSHHLETQVTKMKVVEISSDEEDNTVAESDRDPKVKAGPQRGKEITQMSSATVQPSTVFQPHHEARPTSAQGKREKKKPVAVEVVARPISRQASVGPITPEPSPPAVLEAETDVNMDMGEDDDAELDDHVSMHDFPKTPVRPKPRVSPLKEVGTEAPTPPAEKEAAEPLFVPALSKLPFVPITTLSEAELDMTVEDWIRYQMDAEYDKFRRDGERELQRFMKKAEEVRIIIENL